jgi:hypothetical protein
MTKAAYTCSYCDATGHNARTCAARAADRLRMSRVDATIDGVQLTPDKHPAEWELRKAARERVADRLNAALGALSDKAPAVTHILAALRELKCL